MYSCSPTLCQILLKNYFGKGVFQTLVRWLFMRNENSFVCLFCRHFETVHFLLIVCFVLFLLMFLCFFMLIYNMIVLGVGPIGVVLSFVPKVLREGTKSGWVQVDPLHKRGEKKAYSHKGRLNLKMGFSKVLKLCTSKWVGLCAWINFAYYTKKKKWCRYHGCHGNGT